METAVGNARYVVCMSASVLLHWSLLQPLLFGSQAWKRPPPEESGPGASAASSDADNYMTLVMVNLPSQADASLQEEFSSLGVAESDLQIQVASQDPAPLLQPEQFEQEAEVSEEAAHTAGDPAIQSLLFGRYTGQIDARIQRAWRKPRSAIEPPTKDAEGRTHQKDVFTCQARISQDKVGNVTEIELMQCNGSMEWQMSLVSAIQRASPLPAPPSPTVFTNALTLSFEARAYLPGYREDEYEPRAVEVARADYR
jgi:TonB-like protein